MIATATDLYMLCSDKTILVYSIENLSGGPVVKTDKLENFGGQKNEVSCFDLDEAA